MTGDLPPTPMVPTHHSFGPIGEPGPAPPHLLRCNSDTEVDRTSAVHPAHHCTLAKPEARLAELCLQFQNETAPYSYSLPLGEADVCVPGVRPST